MKHGKFFQQLVIINVLDNVKHILYNDPPELNNIDNHRWKPHELDTRHPHK